MLSVLKYDRMRRARLFSWLSRPVGRNLGGAILSAARISCTTSSVLCIGVFVFFIAP